MFLSNNNIKIIKIIVTDQTTFSLSILFRKKKQIDSILIFDYKINSFL